MKTLFKEPLFDTDGKLRMERLDGGAREVMSEVQEWLSELGRRMFLPLDLLIVLLNRGHEDVSRVISYGTEGVVSSKDVITRLRVLAREVEEDASTSTPKLERTSFSRGFTRILEEAWDQTMAREGECLTEADLVRCVRWRAEAVESASIRWAIRRLSEGKGDELFDQRGLLRMNVFDSAARGILRGAMKLAASHGTSFLGTPHLIAMMASIRDSVLWRSARARGLEPSRLREELIRLIGSKPDSIPEFLIGRKTLTPRMIRMLQFSAQQGGGEEVQEAHFVEAFLADGGSSLELVQALGLESEIRKALGDPRILAGAQPVEAAIQFAARRPASPTLDMLGRDLTEEALAGNLPRIVGREKELQRVFNVLMRREQRNPLLTGEAGVGKTALAIGLAQVIATGMAPAKLQGYRVIEINGASLMGGTSYRGDLEARIKTLVEEASHKVILFMDEAHAVFSPRSGSNTPAEVPNHFKSALASGTIAVVGATTEAEYHRWFEQDPALKRRFERIEVCEPSRPLVRHILSSLVPELEEEYGVQVTTEAVENAIELSVRYLPEQRLPDKAKKLLMDACIARVNRLSHDDDHDHDPDQEPETGGSEKKIIVEHGLDEESLAEESLAEESLAEEKEAIKKPVRVGRAAVAHQVHLKTSIPVERLLRGEISWWVDLEKRLRDSIIGQDAAMSQIARVLVSSRLKNADRRRPLSVLAFVGPSGVGKATAAEALATEIFYDERALIRLDMSDYQEAHALSRLIGSPPGYVGYEDVDMLVTPLRRRPSSVVLLEDFDAAHPRIQERLLRFIEEGELADTRGHRADATNAVFVLTLSIADQASTGTIGFGAVEEGSSRILQSIADTPLANRLSQRVDGVIPFSDLSQDSENGAIAFLDSILNRFIENMKSEYNIEVSFTEELRDHVEKEVRSARKAKDVEAVVDRLLVETTAQALLDGGASSKMTLHWNGETKKVVLHNENDQEVSK